VTRATGGGGFAASGGLPGFGRELGPGHQVAGWWKRVMLAPISAMIFCAIVTPTPEISSSHATRTSGAMAFSIRLLSSRIWAVSASTQPSIMPSPRSAGVL
jgi:hypothetical protein